MKDLNKIYTECQKKLKSIGIQTGEIQKIAINKRARSRWGQCKVVPNRKYEIEISHQLLDDTVPNKAMETVIIHELLHSCPGCMNHGEKWKKLCHKVYVAYGYNIQRTASAEDLGFVETEEVKAKPKYKIVCTKCGNTYYREKICNIVKYPSHYKCGNCGGELKREY